MMDIFKVIAAIILFSMPFLSIAGMCDSMHHFEPLDDDDYDLGPDWKDPL